MKGESRREGIRVRERGRERKEREERKDIHECNQKKVRVMCYDKTVAWDTMLPSVGTLTIMLMVSIFPPCISTPPLRIKLFYVYLSVQ